MIEKLKKKMLYDTLSVNTQIEKVASKHTDSLEENDWYCRHTIKPADGHVGLAWSKGQDERTWWMEEDDDELVQT